MASLHPASIPLPFGVSPFNGLSVDNVERIFYNYSSDGADFQLDFKGKMRLALVCYKFAERIEKRSCWLSERKLVIRCGPPAFVDDDTDEYSIYINGSRFHSDRIGQALHILLNRIRVIKFTLRNAVRMTTADATSLCNSITRQHCSFKLKKLKFEDLDGNTPENLELFACSLNNFELLNVRKIVIDNDSEWSVQSLPLLPIVEMCSNLTFLHVDVYSLSLTNLCNSARNCPKVQTIQISTFNRFVHANATDMAHLVSLTTLCNTLQHLTCLSLQFYINDPGHFAHLLNVDCRSRIKRLSFNLEDDMDLAQEPAYVEFVGNALPLFPNLTSLSLQTAIWNFRDVVLLVSNIFDHYNGHGGDILTFQLFIRIEKVHAVDLFDSLVDQLDAKILIEKSLYGDVLYKCVKGDVEVEMLNIFWDL